MNISIPYYADLRKAHKVKTKLTKETLTETDNAILKLCVYNGELTEHCGKFELTKKGRRVIGSRA